MMSDDSKLATRKSSLLQQGKDGEPPLIPEAVLKRRHDMDEMAARRAANAILNPRGNRKIISTASKRGLVIKVRKPEKILAQAKSRRNYNIRYKRVNKKGMQARASSKPLTKVEDIVVGKNDQGHDVVEKRTVAANSVGSKMIFVVRVRGERNRPTVPRTCLEVLRKLRLNDVNEVRNRKLNLSII